MFRELTNAQLCQMLNHGTTCNVLSHGLSDGIPWQLDAMNVAFRLDCQEQFLVELICGAIVSDDWGQTAQYNLCEDEDAPVQRTR